MTETPDLREQIASLFRSAPGEERLGDQTPGEIADAVLALLPEGFDRFVSTIELLRDRLADTTRERDEARAAAEDLDARRARWALEHEKRRDELAAVEASRRDWAAEAAAMDALAERMLTFHSQHDDRLSFVARRYLADGSGANFRRSRCTGISSDALAWFAVDRREEPKPHEYPADEADLAACERTYKMAPEWLQERMLPVLERYRAHVAGSVHPDSNGGAE